MSPAPERRRRASDEETQSTPHLDARLGNVLFDVWLVSRAATAVIDESVRSSGLDADEFAVYSVLASTGGITPTELAHWMAAPPTTVSSYVKRFSRRGHVESIPTPGDRRSYRLRLTEEGRSAHLEAGRLFRPLLEDVTARLGEDTSVAHDELRSLLAVLQEIRDATRGGREA